MKVPAEELDRIQKAAVSSDSSAVHPQGGQEGGQEAFLHSGDPKSETPLTPVQGSAHIFVPTVHPQTPLAKIGDVEPSVYRKEDASQTVDSRKSSKSPTLVERIVRRRFGKNLREELGIEVYGPPDSKGRQKPLPAASIAEQLAGLFDFACPWAEDHALGLYVYGHGVYIPARKMLNRLLRVILPPTVSVAAYLNEIVNYLKDAESHDLDEFDGGDEGWLNTLTCWVNVFTKETRAHSPEHLSLKQLPVEYDPSAKCPAIDALFLQWVDDPLVLYENIAHALVTSDYPIQSVLVLLGSGQNGKSSYLRIVTEFLGKENVSSVELQNFGTNRFATAKLIGKYANICADLDKRRFTNTAEFKKITGGDPIQAEIKHGALFSFFNYAKVMVSLNQLPVSPDDSDAFHRRIYRKRFERKFRGKDRKRMSDLLRSAREEFSGLLNKCLEVLPALLERQVFNGDTEDTDEKREAYNRSAEPIYGFWQEHLDYNAKEDGTEKNVLYTKFSEYAKANEIPSLKLETFFTLLKSEILKRGFPYETHRVGPESNRGPRLLKGVVHVEKKPVNEADEDKADEPADKTQTNEARAQAIIDEMTEVDR